jgi:hypothetical protein
LILKSLSETGEKMEAALKSDSFHRESLLNLPLLGHALSDPLFNLVQRPLDQRWFYEKLVTSNYTGFNPFVPRTFVASTSWISQWLDDKSSSARQYNPGDALVREIVHALHDYLHSWCYAAIREIRPDLDFGTGKITAKNFEDYVFCHLVTEAAAVVGLDYWYLSTIQLNDFCDIGTAVTGMAVVYKEIHSREYRRLIPELNVQAKEFFVHLASFYCTGDFYGIKRLDTEKIRKLRRSPLSYEWLHQELSYGEKQREYTRLWLSYLSDQNIHTVPKAPVSLDENWRLALIENLSVLLWEKIKYLKIHTFKPQPAPDDAWQASKEKPVDFRFINPLALQDDQLELAMSTKSGLENFTSFFEHYLMSFDFDGFDLELLKQFSDVKEKKDFNRARQLLKSQKRIATVDAGPRDLFILA